MKVPVRLSDKSDRSFSIAGLILHVTLVSVATATIVLGCFGLASIRAQDSAETRVSRLDGDWRSVDPNAGSFAEIVIQGRNLHPYGACHPTACDWGVNPARSFGESVRSSYPVALLAEINNGFSQVWITIRLGNDDRLRVETFTHFTDGSHRADYSNVSFFDRSGPRNNP
jgi:hypothetical protein